jgi:hypothetical protein
MERKIMDPKARNLSLKTQGGDVALLHEKLTKLGFDIPEKEATERSFGLKTEEAIKIFQRKHDLEPTGIVDEKTSALIERESSGPPTSEFVVKGQVVHSDGQPVVGSLVRAFDRDLRSEELLGEAKTDEDGHYEISYTAGKLLRKKKSANLRISACTEDGREIVTSKVIFGAGPEETIDLVIDGVYRGPSEYNRLIKKLTPLLQDLPLADLTEDEKNKDLTFLSGETKEDSQQIAFLILAHRLQKKTGMDAEVFYALFREGLPTQMPSLLSRSPELQRHALQVAVSKNLIPQKYGDKIDDILQNFKGLKVKQAFELPEQMKKEGRTTLIQLLSTALPEKEGQEKFLQAYFDHKGSIEEFWEGLKSKPEFENKIEDLQFTLQLGALTKNHLTLVKKIQGLKLENEITSLQDLTRFDELDWEEMVSKTEIGLPPDVPGKDEREKRKNYAKAMTHMMEDAFPTAFITERIKKETEGDFPGKDDLLTFFDKNPEFDIRATRLEAFLIEKPEAMDSVSDHEGMEKQLKAMQHLYKVAPRYYQTKALMKHGFNSAYSITRKGRNYFSMKFGNDLGGTVQAEKMYGNALQSHAMAISLLAGYWPYGINMMAVPDEPILEVEGVPDWSTLFGSVELCDCEHCKSVNSPAAYLVDILHFLSDRPSRIEDISAKDVLFRRRPDIGEIELTCKNTNTPLPYIDLVNEVLENAVSPYPNFGPFDLDSELEDYLNNRSLSERLRNAFAPPLSAEAVITVGGQGEAWTLREPWWTIDELGLTYTIRKENEGGSNKLTVVARSLQTKGSAAELAANPQYINAGAYEVLQSTVFPWTLPFNLWWEEARVYLQHLKVPRYQIMETFLPGDRLEVLNSIEVACEYLGISSQEAELITIRTEDVRRLWMGDIIPDPADASKLILSSNWLKAISGRLDVFLQQSGLKYKELLDLLDARFINPQADGGRAIHIVSTDEENPDTCETCNLELAGLDRDAALNIVRFVRLWRKLGWSMRNLDKATIAFGSSRPGEEFISPADLDEGLLKQLSHVERLHKELNIPVDRMLYWWIKDDKHLRECWTVTYIDHQAAGQPQVPSLYAQLFRNKAVINPLDSSFTEDPANLSGNLSDHVETLIAAFGISATDFSLLLSDANVMPRDPADDTVPHDHLNLNYLSRLYRHATLAKALRLSIQDYLSALKLNDSDPFATALDTVLFVEMVHRLQDTDFSMNELNYLLRHYFSPSSGIAPVEESIALVLDEIRLELQRIAAENTFRKEPSDPNGVTADPKGDLTRQKLALLNWDNSLIEQTVATLNGRVTYEVPLDLPEAIELPNDTGAYMIDIELPTGSIIPPDLKSFVTYDDASQKLKALRFLTPLERILLFEAFPGVPELENLFKLQDELQGKISYQRESRTLRFTGPMTNVRLNRLKRVWDNQQYQDAIEALFNAPRKFVERNMRTFSVQKFSTELYEVPAGMELPKSLKNKIYFDMSAEPAQLVFIGTMTENERDDLLNLSDDVAYQNAINNLFSQPDGLVPEEVDAFLTAPGTGTDAAAIFDKPKTPEDRFKRVLEKLLPYLRRNLSERMVVKKLAETLNLETKSAEKLLISWMVSPVDSGRRCIDEFLDEIFIESNPNVKLTFKSFDAQFKTFVLLHKVALIIEKLEITPRQLAWLFDYGPEAEWMDLNSLPTDLPTDSQDNSSLFDRWMRTIDLFQLRDSLPMGEQVLSEIFDLVHKGEVENQLLERLSELTGWNQSSLNLFVGSEGLDLTFPKSYRDERALLRLHTCFVLLKRLGMSAKLCCELARGNAEGRISQGIARGVRNAVKAKYDEAQWQNLAKPLTDVLRKKRRAALVDHLLVRPSIVKDLEGEDKVAWRDVNDMFGHFLIDVEMDPCMMTSRIKQANSSVQLFVQRCLMNLEPEVGASATVDDKWREWKWMKNYRVWEANRKVFLYPENWIEPELRDDKSPFFKELESELLQSNLDKDAAEAALRRYLEKLDQVAHLEIVGVYHEKEVDQNTGELVIDVLHVFGRTSGQAHIYYYRRCEDGYWTAWENVDLDIQGEHLIPVIWNGRLYLFWPIFTYQAVEEPMKNPAADDYFQIPYQYNKIQLAWSSYQDNRWEPTKTSVEYFKTIDYIGKKIITSENWSEWMLYSFKTISEESWLDVGIYISRECVYRIGGFHFASCNDEPYVYSSIAPLYSSSWKVCYTPTPRGTRMENMNFIEDIDNSVSDQLYLCGDLPVLKITPGTFKLLAPHQYFDSCPMQPVFYMDKKMDKKRTFFIGPCEVEVPYYSKMTLGPVSLFHQGESVGLEKNNALGNPCDPPLFHPSTPVKFDRPKYVEVNAPVVGLTEVMKTTPEDFELNIRSTVIRSTPINTTLDSDSDISTREILSARSDVYLVSDSIVSGYQQIRGANLLKGPESYYFIPDFLETVPRTEMRYLLQTFYHPYVNMFVRELNRHGLDGLLQRKIQTEPHSFLFPGTEVLDFENDYGPTKEMVDDASYPEENVDFKYNGAYSIYNWELFFHAPLMIADQLNKNQRFEESQKWFHYIFNPTDMSGMEVPKRYWQTKKFFDMKIKDYKRERLQDILKLLARAGNPEERSRFGPDERDELKEFEESVRIWRKNPFSPHVIARMRTTAYQKTVVMKYIDNLMAWGDQLFRQDTIESINEATQLYVLASELLGRRPEEIPPRAIPRIQTYNTLEPKLGELSIALVQIEGFIPPSAEGGLAHPEELPPVPLPMLYFCVPKNEKLLGYWDNVADRLFKIRHCMTIEGVVRQLPLFEPPIEPSLLVKAAAAGIDITSALSDINAALPQYRFNVLVQKATELCAELKSLGSELLSTLEKQDAEGLAVLRAGLEKDLLELVKSLKEKQIEEAEQNLISLRKTRELVVTRYKHYGKLLGSSDQDLKEPEEGDEISEEPYPPLFKIVDEDGIPITNYEEEELNRIQEGRDEQEKAEKKEFTASVIYAAVPDFNISPFGIGISTGGSNIGKGISAVAKHHELESAEKNYQSSLSNKSGQYILRAVDWTLQFNLAAKEIMQIDQQITALTIRKEIAEKDLENHVKQIENARYIEDYMRNKYTNQELYSWMVGQISAIFFRAYEFAYDVAKRAERAYKFELGLKDSNFIQFGYWDNLKKGLLAGEKLSQDIKRMEVAYLEQNKREYEITKHISLAELDPMALAQLKQTGECFVSLSDAIFDLDYPGHYLRRIKSVSLTIPCITGPYTGVNCTLTLFKSSIRHDNTLLNGKYFREEEDPRFTDRLGVVQSIVTSSGQNDSGLFEVNLRDERYLPFEGAGAISEWHIELPRDFRQFDYDTISDVVLHMRYTAREGGGLLKQQATTELRNALNEVINAQGQKGLARLFSLRHEFPSEWHRFLNPPEELEGMQKLTMDLSKKRFPFLFQEREIMISAIELFVKVKPELAAEYESDLNLSLEEGTESPENPDEVKLSLAPWNGLLWATKEPAGKLGEWTLAAWIGESDRLDAGAIEDISLICHYRLE